MLEEEIDIDIEIEPLELLVMLIEVGICFAVLSAVLVLFAGLIAPAGTWGGFVDALL